MFTYLFFTCLIVHCTHCSPVLVVTCVFVFCSWAGLILAFSCYLPEPFCILAMNFIHKKKLAGKAYEDSDYTVMIAVVH